MIFMWSFFSSLFFLLFYPTPLSGNFKTRQGFKHACFQLCYPRGDSSKWIFFYSANKFIVLGFPSSQRRHHTNIDLSFMIVNKLSFVEIMLTDWLVYRNSIIFFGIHRSTQFRLLVSFLILKQVSDPS